MAETPEGKVKRLTREFLKRYKGMYTYMPVSNGMGTPSLDLIGCYNGLFFAIEFKALKKKPTDRQMHTIAEMEHAGATVFVITGTDPDQLAPLRLWLEVNDNSREPPASSLGSSIPK